MRKIAGVGHVGNEFADYDAISNPTGTVITAQWMNDAQRELMGIQDELSIAEADGSNKYILSAIKGLIIRHSKRVGELFWLDELEAPAEFDKDDPESFFPAVCLSSIETKSDISATNYASLVTHLRAKRATYLHGKTGAKYAFDVTNWAISSNVATLTFANATAENKLLAALAEENLVHGGYTNWMTVTLGAAIGDITAGDYAITGISTVARTITFAFTAGDNSGAGTFTVNFYPHRIAGSTTTARLFEVSGRTIVSQGEAAGECIAGFRRRDRHQLHRHAMTLTTYASTGSNNDAARGNTGNTDITRYAELESEYSSGGTPRTGTTTDPRALIGHLYIWAGDYAA